MLEKPWICKFGLFKYVLDKTKKHKPQKDKLRNKN